MLRKSWPSVLKIRATLPWAYQHIESDERNEKKSHHIDTWRSGTPIRKRLSFRDPGHLPASPCAFVLVSNMLTIRLVPTACNAPHDNCVSYTGYPVCLLTITFSLTTVPDRPCRLWILDSDSQTITNISSSVAGIPFSNSFGIEL